MVEEEAKGAGKAPLLKVCRQYLVLSPFDYL